jgi:hypothetical protein
VEALRSILIQKQEGRSGTYKVRLRDIANEVFRSVSVETPPEISEELVLKLIQHATARSDTVVLTSVWMAFAKDRKINPAVEKPVGGKGSAAQGRSRRPPLANWEQVYRQLAAVLFAELEERCQKLHLKTVAARVFSSLTGGGQKSSVTRNQVQEAVNRSRTRFQALKRT